MLRRPTVFALLTLLGCSGSSSQEAVADAPRAVTHEELRAIVRQHRPREHYRMFVASLPPRPNDSPRAASGPAVIPAIVVRASAGDCDPGEFVGLATAVANLSTEHRCVDAACVQLFCLGETKTHMFAGLDPTSAPLWFEGEKRPLPFVVGSEEAVN